MQILHQVGFLMKLTSGDHDKSRLFTSEPTELHRCDHVLGGDGIYEGLVNVHVDLAVVEGYQQAHDALGFVVEHLNSSDARRQGHRPLLSPLHQPNIRTDQPQFTEVKEGMSPLPGAWQATLCDLIWYVSGHSGEDLFTTPLTLEHSQQV